MFLCWTQIMTGTPEKKRTFKTDPVFSGLTFQN